MLRDLKIRRVVTLHNHPENLRLASGIQRLQASRNTRPRVLCPTGAYLPTVCAVPPTRPAAVHGCRCGDGGYLPVLRAVLGFHQGGGRCQGACARALRRGGQQARQPRPLRPSDAFLLSSFLFRHRSACIVMSYLMRKLKWNADKCNQHVKARRSVVEVNEGFKAALRAYEALVGIVDRSAGPTAPPAAAAAQLLESGAQKVAVAVRPLVPEAMPGTRRGHRSRSRSRGRGDRSRSRSRRRSRSRSRDRHYRRRSRSRSRSRDRRRARSREPESIPPPPPAVPGAGAPARAAAVPANSKRFVIEVVKDGTKVGEVEVPCLQPGQRVCFGRAADCEVVAEHASISRQHAQISLDLSGTLLAADLGSAHGTQIGGVWVKPKVPKPVEEGTMIKLGASTRVYMVTNIRNAAQ